MNKDSLAAKAPPVQAILTGLHAPLGDALG
jgi:hypothetical protein